MKTLALNERIKVICELLFENNKSKMGHELGGKNNYQNINNWTNEKNKLSLKNYLKLYTLVEDKINAEWYLTGKGNPLKTKVEENSILNDFEKIISDKNLLISNQQELIKLLKKDFKI